MIDIRPTPGDLGSEFDFMYEKSTNTPIPNLTSKGPDRVTQVLGPDGNPVRVPVARHVLGFDLRPRHGR